MERALHLKEEGNAAFRANAFDKAAALYEQAVAALTSESGLSTKEGRELAVVCHSNHAQALISKKDFEPAIECASAAIKIDENHSKSYFRRGYARERLGRVRDAFFDYWRAHTLEPENESVQDCVYRTALRIGSKRDELNCGVLRVAHARACVVEAVKRAQAGQFDRAADLLFQFALSGYQHAAPQPPPEALADVLIHSLKTNGGTAQAGVLYAFFLSSAKPAEALAELDKVLSAADVPQRADIHVFRGFIRGVNDDSDGALADFTRALSLEPKHARALYLRGKALRTRGMLDDAIADLREAVQCAGLDEFGLPDMIYELCGLMLQQKHRLEEVEPLFRRGLEAEQVHRREYGPPPRPWMYRGQVLRMIAAQKGLPLPPPRSAGAGGGAGAASATQSAAAADVNENKLSMEELIAREFGSP